MLEALKNIPSWLRLMLVLPLLFLNGFLLSLIIKYLEPVVSFVIIASILAFLLELGVNFLVQKGMKRGIAITFILLITFISIIILGLILIPLLIEQLGQLVTNIPQWIQETNKHLENWSNLPIFERFSIDINSIILDINQQLADLFKSFGGKILDFVAGTVASILNIILILVLSIFLLIGGDKFWGGIFSYFPEPWNNKIPQYTQETFKDYFLARLTLVVISSTARWLLLLLVGVPYSALFGFGFGIAGFIPLVGGILSLIGLIILCFNSVAAGVKFFIISFIVDQINDNVLAPRIMGTAIGLNPVWLILSLFIGAKIGGILGLFLAVPVASIIKKMIDDLRNPVVDSLPPLEGEEEVNAE